MSGEEMSGPTIDARDMESVAGYAEDEMHALMAGLFNAERLDRWIAGIAQAAYVRGVRDGWKQRNSDLVSVSPGGGRDE